MGAVIAIVVIGPVFGMFALIVEYITLSHR